MIKLLLRIQVSLEERNKGERDLHQTENRHLQLQGNLTVDSNKSNMFQQLEMITVTF